MFLLYDLLFILFSFLYLPYLLLKRKWHKDFWTRFGFLDKDKLKLAEKERIWIHAVSVGEVVLIKNLLVKIRSSYPNCQIIISVVTKTGFDLAKSIVARDEVVIYAPLDLSFAVRRYCDVLTPKIYLNAETELWPNLLTELHKRLIPIVQINGRISDQAFKGYKTFKSFLFPVLSCISCFCMQSESDAKRIKELGAAEGKVFVVGNMKFDDVLDGKTGQIPQAMASRKGKTLVAGSTHPGEEQIILDVVLRIKPQFSDLSLILAPRHPDRAGEIIDLCTEKGFKAIKFSQIQETIDPGTVIVVDTIGHLRALYSLADVVFLGKSLTAKGGHNIIEPACYGKPIIVGPFMQNFRDITKLFLEGDALIQVAHKAQLEQGIEKLLRDENLRRKMGMNAQAVIKNNQGATDKTFAMISRVMGF